MKCVIAVALAFVPFVTSSACGQEQQNSAQTIEFKPLVMVEPATSMALTEDGRFLVVTHQAANMVSIFDAATLTLATSLETPSPRCVLCRGEDVYISNDGEGTISCFSGQKNWELVNRYDVGMPHIVFMSAPQGANFDRKMLVTCHPPERQGSYHGPFTYGLDLRKDHAKRLWSKSLASMSYDGKLVLCQTSFNLSPGGQIEVFPSADYGTEKPIIPLDRGGVSQTPFLYQTHPGSYWIGNDIVFAGTPIQPVREKLGAPLIPDLSQRLVYSFIDNRMNALRLDSALTEIGSRKVSFPPNVEKNRGSIGENRPRRFNYLLDHPIGWTEGDVLRLFVIDMERNAILAAHTPAFVEVRAKPIRPDNNSPDKDTFKEIPAERKTSSAKPADAAPKVGELGVPARHIEGDFLNLQLAGPAGASYELLTGPSGMKLTGGGLLLWVPAEQKVGVHRLKIRVKNGRSISFSQPTIEVVGKELASAHSGSIDDVDKFEKLELDLDALKMTPGLDAKSVLLLQGDRLRTLGPDGFTVTHELKLPERYSLIAERASHFVAVATAAGKVDLLDKKTGRIRKSIPLDSARVRILEVMDLAAPPTQGLVYLTIKHDVDLPRYRILIVDEERGTVVAPEGAIGTWLAIDPTGKRLYAGYKDLYERGSQFHINPGWRLIEIPEYGNIDWVISYDIRGTSLSPRQVDMEAGGNGNGIRLSADGQRLTYLSFVGTPLHSRDLSVWKTSDFKTPPVRYALKDRGVTNALAFHPSLEIAAVPGGNSAILLHRETGAELQGKLLLTAAGLGDVKVDDLYFAPDGQSLVFACNAGADGRYLRRVGLRLSAAEVATAARGRVIPPTTPTKPQTTIPVAEFDALRSSRDKADLSAKEIARRYIDAVVGIKSEHGSGTGFIIGRRGYILTCAHVLPEEDRVNVLLMEAAGNSNRSRTVVADVLRRDDERDIAILKIPTTSDLTSVLLSASETTDAGEIVTVIGNPGAGEKVFSQSLTTGVVSSSKRELDGRTYIQTSAAINPGNSGGPMFDSHGAVIGLVVLKARIEGVAFAIPADDLRAFLLEATKK